MAYESMLNSMAYDRCTPAQKRLVQFNLAAREASAMRELTDAEVKDEFEQLCSDGWMDSSDEQIKARFGAL
ncbi:MAG: hypothetical protein ACYTEQ_25585 [Planctomycetota bacterium]|jgi:hypothetical protein